MKKNKVKENFESLHTHKNVDRKCPETISGIENYLFKLIKYTTTVAFSIHHVKLVFQLHK